MSRRHHPVIAIEAARNALDEAGSIGRDNLDAVLGRVVELVDRARRGSGR